MPDPEARPPTVADHVGYVLYRAFALLVEALPRRAVLRLGQGLGGLLFILDGRHRRIALDNLRQAFERERDGRARRTIARLSFENFGRTTLETLKISRWPRERVQALIDIEGRDNLVRALAQGRGALLIAAHFGNWEMVVPASSQIAPFHVIARPLDNPLIDRDLARARTLQGAVLLNKSGAGRLVLRALARGHLVGILIDQNVLRREAVFVDFFGRAAATTPAPAVFHLRTGAPLLPMFCYPTPGGRYRFRFFPPLIIPRTGRADEDVLKITSVCTKMIESEIRERPGLWLWVHKRWQSRPSNER